MRFALSALTLSLMTACLDPGNLGPDGGRVRVNCDTVSATWPVEVIDFAGAPVSGADVTAVNDTNMSLKQAGKTDARGIFLIDGTVLGTGTVTVTATYNALRTNTGRFTFTPSECAGSLVEPRDLRLQLMR